MKKLLFVLFLLGSLTFTKAQAYNGPGDQKLDLGISAFGYGTGISGSYDFGILDWFSIGAGADFYWGNNNNDGKDDNFFIFGRANFHLGDALNLPRNMDLYPGVNIGGRNNGFGIGAHLGYRYFFTNKIGGFVEIGSHGVIGVSINL